MRLDDYNNDDELYNSSSNNLIKSNTVVLAAVFTGLVVAISIIAVYIANGAGHKRSMRPVSVNTSSNEIYKTDDLSDYISGSTLRAEDLTIWDDPHTSKVSISSNIVSDNSLAIASPEPMEKERIHIEYSDGTTEEVDINQYLSRNSFEKNDFVFKKPFMYYFKNNRQASYVGVDISKEEDYVDFNLLKKEGVDYVMIKLGQRGDFSGDIGLDDNFYDNLERAKEAGLDVGVYFEGAAISKDEAKEEASFVIDTISDNSIDYPVAYYVNTDSNSSSRTNSITQMQRTNYAKAFMDDIKEAGYYPLLYGNKEWLIKKYSIGSLNNYDIWLEDYSDLSDYPYPYSMWRYSASGDVDGISGYCNLDICFVDFSIK